MNQKIIIKTDDLDREICSFLTEIGAGILADWNEEALDPVRNAVIEAFEKMGITLEIDDRPQSPISKWKSGNERITETSH